MILAEHEKGMPLTKAYSEVAKRMTERGHPIGEHTVRRTCDEKERERSRQASRQASSKAIGKTGRALRSKSLPRCSDGMVTLAALRWLADQGASFVMLERDGSDSGVMTFIVDKSGVVYRKDLGDKTPEIASSIQAFDPDKTWEPLD